MPALLTRMSRCPNSFRISCAILNVSGKSATSACASVARRPILRICSTTSLAAARWDVVDGDVGTLLGERPRDGTADPAGGAGDERGATLELHRVLPSLWVVSLARCHVWPLTLSVMRFIMAPGDPIPLQRSAMAYVIKRYA